MLNKYLELLQYATEVMTSVGKSGAGAAEYFQAVGYEFLVVGLGLLYLAGIVLLIAVPVLVFYYGIFRGGFASEKLKEMYKIAEKYVDASDQYENLRDDFAYGKKKYRVENFEKLCEYLGKYYETFNKDVGYNMVPGKTMEEKGYFLKRIQNPYDFSCRFPHLFGICGWKLEYGVHAKITKFDLFNDIVKSGEEPSVFTDQVKKLYSTEDEFCHDVKIFKTKCVSIMVAAMVLYAIFVLPLCFMFF